MKKAILITAIALISAVTTFAQVTKAPAQPVKKDTAAAVKKDSAAVAPAAEQKQTIVYTIQLQLTDQDISILTTSIDQWKQMEVDKTTGEELTARKQWLNSIFSAIVSQRNNIYQQLVQKARQDVLDKAAGATGKKGKQVKTGK